MRPATRRSMRSIALLLAMVLALLLAPSTPAGAATPPQRPLEGVSLDVQDGDSLVFRGSDGTTQRVRVAGIDAPEKSQPFAEASRRNLRALLREVRRSGVAA